MLSNVFRMSVPLPKTPLVRFLENTRWLDVCFQIIVFVYFFFGTLHVDCTQITMSMLQYINNPFPFFHFKDLIVGDAVIQNPFEWNVVSIFYYWVMLCLWNMIKEDWAQQIPQVLLIYELNIFFLFYPGCFVTNICWRCGQTQQGQRRHVQC